MKKILFLMPVLAILFLMAACTTQKLPSQPHVIQNTKVSISGKYLGSDYKGNYVWGGAMNLAWNELNENILHEKLKLNTGDQIALEMADKFNNPVFTKNDLDAASYYIKSGYGQETVEIINKESKKKFPSKSFSDLEMSLDPTDIISYAYFLKEVEYKNVFETKDVLFGGQKVSGFYAGGESQRDNIKIIKYENDDKFIVSLELKDENDRLILAKGYDMTNPNAVVDEINQNKAYSASIGEADRFEAPKLHLDHHRDYVELIEKYLANKGFEEYFIAQMFENIKFDMDEKGARVENEAVIVMKEFAIMEPEKPKNLILDKPYWVVMQRKDSENPYFILGVNNTELMEISKIIDLCNKEENCCVKNEDCRYVWYTGGCNTPEYVAKMQKEAEAQGRGNSESPLKNNIECSCENKKCKINTVSFLENFLNEEILRLSQSSIFINKYYIEFDNAKTYTFWLYANTLPTKIQVENVVSLLANKLSDRLPGYYLNFGILPEDYKKIPSERLQFDSYFEVSWRNGKVLFPFD